HTRSKRDWSSDVCSSDLTPLYVYDEATLRDRCRRYRAAFAAHYPDAEVVYAAKAYLSPALIPILVEEGLGIDVVSGGELGLALRDRKSVVEGRSGDGGGR